jgi:hypothetical protein
MHNNEFHATHLSFADYASRMITAVLFRILCCTFATEEGKSYNVVCSRYSLIMQLGRRNNQSRTLEKKIFIIHTGNRITIPRSINRSLFMLTELSRLPGLKFSKL